MAVEPSSDWPAPVLLDDAPALAGRRVELFWLGPPVAGAVVAARDLALLSRAERERADAFRFPRHRAAFVRRRAVLRRLLAARLDADPAALAFEAGPNGKPALAGGPAFNLSRAGDAALIALADHGRLGVDLERSGRVRDLEAVAARILHPDERPAWAELPPSEREAAFTRVWTRKEALLKATGEGLRRDPATLLVGLDAGAAERRVALPGGVALVVVDRAVPARFAASLAGDADGR